MKKRVAIIACALGLPGERGYSRFAYLSSMLCKYGYSVDLYTSSFNHWDKKQRDSKKIKEIQKAVPYKIKLSYEPGYKKNVDIKRIISHNKLSRNIIRNLDENNKKLPYDLLYVIIPDNKLAANVSEYGKKHKIPVIVDIEDLWPEGMEQLLHIPSLVSRVVFAPFRKNARKAYNNADAYVGTSDEFRDEPLKYNAEKSKPRITVYVGCDLEIFDKGIRDFGSKIEKGDDEFWVTYTGTLGSSYDINTLIKAAQVIKNYGNENIKFMILGEGPLKQQFESLAAEKPCNVRFLGYVQYEKMAAYLAKSDVTVNSFVKSAPQSIVNKVGDYLAAGKPMINTLSSPEFKAKVDKDGFGVNVCAEDVDILAEAIIKIYNDSLKAEEYGRMAREIAETQFDRKTSYKKIIELIDEIIAKQ